MPLAMYYADKKPVLVDKNSPMLKASRLMLSNNRYHAVLVDGEGRLSGILSIRDVARAIFVVGEEAVELIEAGSLARVLENPVHLYATQEVVSIGKDDTLESALRIMVDRNIGSLPIVDAENRVVGVLEEKQVIKAMPIHTKKSVCDYATWNVLTVDANDEVLEAVGIMITNNIRRVVVTRGGEPIGMTTLNIVIDFLLSPSSLEKLLSGDESPLSKPVKRVTLKPWVADCSYSLRELASIFTFDPLGAALIEKEGKYGVLTERDLLRALRDSFSDYST